MSKLVFKCVLCDFHTKKYETKWRGHLLGERHQKLTRERNRTLRDADKKRTCVVFGIRELGRGDVLSFFSEENVVTEFIFWKECPDVCLVGFPISDVVAAVARRTKSILGNEVVVRLRNEISDVEWRSIFPMLAGCVKKEESLSPQGSKLRDIGCNAVQTPVVLANVKKEPNEELLTNQVSSSDAVQVAGILETRNSKLHETERMERNQESRESAARKRQAYHSSESESYETNPTERSSLPQNAKFPADVPNSFPPLKKPREETDEDQNESSAGQSGKPSNCKQFHLLALVPSKMFLLEAAKIENRSFHSLRKDFNPNLSGFWVQLVQEFNLVVWENIFGFELYEVTANDIERLHPLNPGCVRCGPLIKGSLTVIDKIERWTKEVKSRDLDKVLNDCKGHFLNCVKKGLKSKALRCFDGNARSLCEKETSLLSFDLHTVNGVPGTNPVHLAFCELRFQNIIRSPEFNFDLLKRILQLYNCLWREFSLLKIKESYHHYCQ